MILGREFFYKSPKYCLNNREEKKNQKTFNITQEKFYRTRFVK